ncbi:hypothetical protein JOF56_000187 [Kibdelosporangium banguiense]|uniref:DUF397 domain-containing protein n=1 Tax=Kibdelosporangium banguiense TaxID=1365924 RepID=A0ABS4T5R9_9PSEU|nr:hypothetical protein [Kibdelosporangium banguiense]MBP2319802.1 hypothetical protein [Kibdelosporangium banguiense]
MTETTTRVRCVRTGAPDGIAGTAAQSVRLPEPAARGLIFAD